jgi:hypothetical protein
MMKSRCIGASLLAVALLVLSAAQAQTSKGIKLGEDFEGEVGGQKYHIGSPGNYAAAKFRTKDLGWANGEKGFLSEVPVNLKAGQKLVISVTVRGTDRRVSLVLADKSGEVVAFSKAPVKRSAQLAVEEVNATGPHVVAVISDRIGAFTLRVDAPSDKGGDKLDEKELKARIKKLKKELAELEEKLEALQEKKEKQLSK